MNITSDNLSSLKKLSAAWLKATTPAEVGSPLLEEARKRLPEWTPCFYHYDPARRALRTTILGPAGTQSSGFFVASKDNALAATLRKGERAVLSWERDSQAPCPVTLKLIGGKLGKAVFLPIRDEKGTLAALGLLAPAEATDGSAEVIDLLESFSAMSMMPLRHLLRENIRASEKRDHLEQMDRSADFRFLFDEGTVAMAVVDTQGRIEAVNREMGRLLGEEPARLIGHDLLNHVAIAALPPVATALEHHARSQRFEPFETVMVNTKGQTLAVGVSGQPLPGDGRRLTLFFQDLSRQQALERELRETTQFLSNVIASSVDAIMAVDCDGRIILFNHAAERLIGHPASEVIGKLNVRKIYRSGDAERIMRLMRSPQQGEPGRLVNYQAEVVGHDGQPVPIMLNAAILYRDGKEAGSVGIFSDLREKMRTLRELEQHRVELMDAKQKQDLIGELAGAAAHELNQPLTVILGYIELLRLKKAQGRTDQILDTLNAEAERLKEKVQRLGRITRYETKSYAGTRRILDLLNASE